MRLQRLPIESENSMRHSRRLYLAALVAASAVFATAGCGATQSSGKTGTTVIGIGATGPAGRVDSHGKSRPHDTCTVLFGGSLTYTSDPTIATYHVPLSAPEEVAVPNGHGGSTKLLTVRLVPAAGPIVASAKPVPTGAGECADGSKVAYTRLEALGNRQNYSDRIYLYAKQRAAMIKRYQSAPGGTITAPAGAKRYTAKANLGPVQVLNLVAHNTDTSYGFWSRCTLTRGGTYQDVGKLDAHTHIHSYTTNGNQAGDECPSGTLWTDRSSDAPRLNFLYTH
jgi:hypothetical protein